MTCERLCREIFKVFRWFVMSTKKARSLIQSSLVTWGRDLPLDDMSKSLSFINSKNLFSTVP